MTKFSKYTTFSEEVFRPPKRGQPGHRTVRIIGVPGSRARIFKAGEFYSGGYIAHCAIACVVPPLSLQINLVLKWPEQNSREQNSSLQNQNKTQQHSFFTQGIFKRKGKYPYAKLDIIKFYELCPTMEINNFFLAHEGSEMDDLVTRTDW